MHDGRRSGTEKTAEAARFDAFVAPARLRPELWRLAAGIGTASAFWLAGAMAAGWATADAGPRIRIAAYLFSFGGLIAGLALAVAWLHGRRFAGLFGPGGFRPRAAFKGFVLVAALAAVLAWPAVLSGAAPRAQPFDQWARWAPFMLAALAVQVTAEELAFRGYLQQQLAARWANRWVWQVLPALFFGALHWNPDLGPNAALAAAAAAVTGLVYGDVAARLGDLSVPIGLHFANNAFALLMLAPPGPLGVFALHRSPIEPSDVASMRAGLLGTTALTVAVWGVWRAAAGLRARSLQRRGPGSI